MWTIQTCMGQQSFFLAIPRFILIKLLKRRMLDLNGWWYNKWICPVAFSCSVPRPINIETYFSQPADYTNTAWFYSEKQNDWKVKRLESKRIIFILFGKTSFRSNLIYHFPLFYHDHRCLCPYTMLGTCGHIGQTLLMARHSSRAKPGQINP